MENQETMRANPSQGTSERRLAWAILLAALISGWFVPAFYDWSGANQSRPAPVIGWVGLCIVAGDLILILLLAWLHYSQNLAAPELRKPIRFNLAHILILMTCCAVLLALARLTSIQIVSRLFQAIVFAIGIWIAIRFPRTRFWIIWLASLQVIPFLWVFRQSAFSNSGTSLLPLLTSLPALFPAAIFVAMNDEEAIMGVMTLLTSAELSIGLWLIYLGPKRTLAWGLVVLTFAIFSSFALNAVSRM